MPNHQEIISKLSSVIPKEAIFSITTETILSAIVNRLGEEALDLSPEDLALAEEEVKAAIEHNLDVRDFIDMGLDAWEVTRHL